MANTLDTLLSQKAALEAEIRAARTAAKAHERLDKMALPPHRRVVARAVVDAMRSTGISASELSRRSGMALRIIYALRAHGVSNQSNGGANPSVTLFTLYRLADAMDFDIDLRFVPRNPKVSA